MSIEEEIMKAIGAGTSDRFIITPVGTPEKIRGYIITDKETGVRVADYVYSHNLAKYELKIRPGYDKEIEATKESASENTPNAILTSDYTLLVKYVDYVFNYIDNIIRKLKGTEMIPRLEGHKEALNNGYGLAIYAAANDIDDYSQMPGFEERVKEAEKQLREYTIEFERQFLALFPEGFSFNDSPVYLEAKKTSLGL